MPNDEHDLTKLRLPQLQDLFKRATGAATRSPNRTFLIRRIREAQGATRGEPRASKAEPRSKGGRMMVLPVRLEASVVRRLDAAYKRQGIASRMEMFRRALEAFLRAAGEDEVAALFTKESAS